MALRRSITARAKQLYEQYRVAPFSTARAKQLYEQYRVAPFSTHIHRDDDNYENLPHDHPISNNPRLPISNNPQLPNYFQHRLFGTGNNLGTFHGSRNFFNDWRFSIPAVCGPAFLRSMSSLGKGPAEKIEILTDVADVLGEGAVEVAAQVSPMVNEVAVAAADSLLPVALHQYLIGHVHTISGFNWWASIVLTTILIRWSLLPVRISQTKSNLLRPRLEAINEDMLNRDMNPAAVAEGQARMKELFKEYGVTRFTPLKTPLMGHLISSPIKWSFFFAVKNMAEKVPSFQEGGVFWFTDLTTPDRTYILPVLSALASCIAAELGTAVEGNPRDWKDMNVSRATVKNVFRAFFVLTIPLTATFLPKAIFFYWITSNLFSITYGLALKKPEVKKLLGMPVSPPSSPGRIKEPEERGQRKKEREEV